MTTVCHFSLLHLCTLILLVRARSDLETTDHAFYKDDLGKIPSGLSSLLRLRILDVSYNKFSGDLDFLKYFSNLEKLSLINNMLTRKLVPASLRSLRFFNISGNSILESPSTKNKNFVPKRYIFAESKNDGDNSGNLQAQGPSTTGEPNHKHKNMAKVKRWLLWFSSGVLVLIMCGTIFLFNLHLNKKEKYSDRIAIFSFLVIVEDLRFLEKDDGVASLQVIGKGGCGDVYKAKLRKSKVKSIAIKKVIETPKDAAELTDEDTRLLTQKLQQIKSEIKTIGRIRHRNLLPLLAHVSSPSCHYLVYEFMKNGSLQDILQEVKDGSRELDWLARHKIALGVAAGLEYLHMSHTPRIVHRDLKPANILLDDDMEARIADFGLAKSIPDADTHMTTFNICGTLGYIAPEYFETMEFNDKCDIFSFGVLLAALVTGKQPSDEFFLDTYEMSLVKWMRNVMLGEDPKQAIDPKLLGNGFEEQMLLVLKVSCFCTLDNPNKRPDSKDCRIMLAQINHS